MSAREPEDNEREALKPTGTGRRSVTRRAARSHSSAEQQRALELSLVAASQRADRDELRRLANQLVKRVSTDVCCDVEKMLHEASCHDAAAEVQAVRVLAGREPQIAALSDVWLQPGTVAARFRQLTGIDLSEAAVDEPNEALVIARIHHGLAGSLEGAYRYTGVVPTSADEDRLYDEAVAQQQLSMDAEISMILGVIGRRIALAVSGDKRKDVSLSEGWARAAAALPPETARCAADSANSFGSFAAESFATGEDFSSLSELLRAAANRFAASPPSDSLF